MTEANPYDAVVSQYSEEKLRGSMQQAVDRQPDSEAVVQTLAKRYNLPAESVRLYKPEVEHRAKMEGLDYGTIVNNFSATANFLSDPNNASLAHDDVENLLAQEALYGVWQTPTGPKPGLGSVLYGLGSSFATGGELTRQGMRQQFADAMGWSDMSADAQKKAARARFEQSIIDPAFESSTAEGLYGGGRSLLQMAPGIAGTILTRNPYIALGAAGLQSETDAYTKYRERGASPLLALTGAAGEGAVEVGTEMLPMGVLVDKFGKTGATKFLTEFLGKELAGEEVATLAQDAIDTAIANPDKTWAQYISERPNAAYQTALGTLVATGALTAAHEGAYRISGERERARKAEENAKAFEQLNELAAASKLRQRNPEAFQQFVDKATEGGPVQEVYLDPRVLAQAGIDPNELASVSPSVAEQFQTAIDTGADIKIPVGEFAASIAGTDLGQALVNHIKTDPQGMTLAEAEEFNQNEAKQFEAEVQKVLEEKKGDDTFNASRQVVHDDILRQLTEANRFTKDVNEPYAALHSAVVAVQAAKVGVTPEEFYKKYYPQTNKFVQVESTAGNTLDQAAFHGSPFKFDQFTLDHIGKGEGAQAYGWGLYFAGAKEVAEFYRQSATQPKITESDFQSEIGRSLAVMARGNPGRVLNELQDARARDGLQQEEIDALEHDMAVLREDKPRGQLYKAEIPEDDVMLQWEKPLSEQPEVVQQALEDVGGEASTSGSAYYRALSQRLGGDEAASKYLSSLGVKGIKYRDANSRVKGANENITHNYVVFDDSAINVLGTFYQGSDTRRGSFNPTTSTITLLKAADLSTFLHESGHFFLETMNKLALEPNAPQEIVDDFNTTLKWLGINHRLGQSAIEQWNAKDLEQQREAHEQFARGFEAYLFEGKSPSVEMQGVFQRFRAWLLNVYRSLRNLNVELADDIRQVFDRMLATSDQIKEAEAARNFAPLFTKPEDAGMTAEEYKAYHDLGVQATQDAITTLETRSLRDMQWLSNAKGKLLKQLQRDAEAKRKAIRREVTDEVMSEPVNLARQFLKRGEVSGKQVEGPHRISIDALKEMYGEVPAELESKFGRYGILGKDGLHPDVVAEMFGLTSGDELIKQLIGAEDARQKIAGLTDQRMLERYGDLTDPQTIERAAEAAIHNDARARFVAAEMNALQKATGGRKVLASAAKDFAERTIARLKVRDLKPNRYAAAEARAAKAAAAAHAKGNLAEAAMEKRNQLIQNYATKAAIQAAGEIEKSVRYLQKFDREGTRKSIDTDYLDQIDALLDRFDLRKNTSLKAIDKRKSLETWAKAQEEMGLEPDLPPEMLNEANRKHFKDMTIEEMRGLVDTVKQIEHIGRLKEKLLTAKDNRDFKATVEGLVKSIAEHGQGKRANNITRATKSDAALRVFKGFFAEHRKVASLVRELDGFKDGGAMWETFARTMNEAGDKETSMREQATVKLFELIKPLKEGGKMGGKGQFFPSIGRSLNREERIGMALNVGNAGNFQRLLDGEGWTHAQIAPVLDTLTKEDWDFVQNIWDFVESYRPEIGAKERRVYGKEPNWIEPTPVNTKYGQYRGGYYPIKYDPRRSAAAEQHDAAEAAKQAMKGAYTSATTRRSFTKARADEVKGRPLLLSMTGLYNGVHEIIHDLSWHEWLIDAGRLLRNKSLDNAIRSRYGADVIQQFKKALDDISKGETITADALEKVLGNLRAGATVAAMGVNLMNSVINVTGVTQSMVRIGPRWVARGIGEWIASPVGLLTQVHEKSDFMRNRAKTQQREINEIRSLIQGKTKLRAAVDRMLFLPVTATQMAVDTPTWWGAYQKALAEGNEEKRSIALADQAVIDAQGSGMVKDLAAIQRGGPYKKLFTTFYSFFSTTYNLTVERTKATKFTDPLDVMRLGGDYLMLYTVPALLGTLLKAALTGGPDDDDALKKALINDQISYLMGTVVGLREVTGAAQMVAGVNQYNTGYGGPAGLRFIQELYKLGQQVHQGEIDRALTRSAINVAGVVLHLPSTQVNRTIDGIAALAEGKTKNPLAVVAGAPPKR